ncbi:ABC transporter family protein [Collimonas arenae]|uniref:ABC transporter family protein n=1 Tax=Collimonas arenae TaxID=279058 RepID=A0A127QME4_9BURK|nr:ABC transporter ATP-binding protein [Collimonas arenae]AMP01306.1 ABC transporter family protein [Collimonas arenae]AMP11204.1 ABC transporter family protein [Collimonas arenae]
MSELITPLLQAEQLSVSVGGRVLCERLAWQILPGQFWCILGRNGIGKSTLLHTLAGLHKPAGGRVLIQGQDIQATTAQQLARLRGLLAQQQADAFSSSVLTAVIAGRHPYQFGFGWDREDDRELAMQALEQVKMAAFSDHDVLRLSGGERQRVALATLLAQDPLLLMLDEPTAHQDAAAQIVVMELLHKVANPLPPQKAVIAACHDINLVSRYATHVLLLGDGKSWQGSADSVLQPDILQTAFGCQFEVMENGARRLFVPTADIS